MSLIIGVLLIWSGIISFFLFYFGVLVSSKWEINSFIERILDGSITSFLLVVITSASWIKRKTKYGYFAFGILILITAFWFYFLTVKLSYPTLSLKVNEKDLFPSEILEKLSQTLETQNSLKDQESLEITNEKTPTNLIFVLPSLSDMFILHAIKRILEQKKQKEANFTWHLVLTEEPLETPLLAILREQANISILQDDEISTHLIDDEKSSFSKTNKPLFFFLSSDNSIQWLLNPTSMYDLLLFDINLNQSINNQLWE
jgi:hypothetical protein